MINFETKLSGKRVFVTGHTGFTGSWTGIWLDSIGANVFGYALAPITNPSLFSEAGIEKIIPGKIGDIRDFNLVLNEMRAFKPDLVLHLAAQPLVLESYRNPRETFEINCQGTANVLEAARKTSSVRGVLCVTTDKVYKNLETGRRFRESDELGGKDPYSSSKAAAEMVISSYRHSFNAENDGSPWISVARGGNIIGGGDWSENRLIPDFVRAYKSSSPLVIRSPQATRPWQHVLSLVEGYLRILSGLLSEEPQRFSQPFNFGPNSEEELTVVQILEQLEIYLGSVELQTEHMPEQEAIKLSIESGLAHKVLGWKPRWTTDESVRQTALWYKSHLTGQKSALDLCTEQINLWKAQTGVL